MMAGTDVRGRRLPVVVNDRESETRTPAQALYRIPEAARDRYAPVPPLAFMRPGESDLTRLAPGGRRRRARRS